MASYNFEAIRSYSFSGKDHAREPLYSNSVVIACWLQSTIKQNSVPGQLAWVQSSIFWQNFLMLIYQKNKRIKIYHIKGIGCPLLISINIAVIFDQGTEK